MMKVYSGIKGLVVLLFLAAGLILFFSVFFWGIAKAAELLLPLLTVLAYNTTVSKKSAHYYTC